MAEAGGYAADEPKRHWPAGKREQGLSSKEPGPTAKRGWKASFGLAAATVGLGVLLSATLNPLLGRAVHWDWMAVVVPVLFIGLVLVLRNRKV